MIQLVEIQGSNLKNKNYRDSFPNEPLCGFLTVEALVLSAIGFICGTVEVVDTFDAAAAWK